MDKLKSENLMTGNYLQKDGVIHQILSISGSLTDKEKSIKKAATIRTDKSSEYMFLNHFEPVLITKDILKKLGLTFLSKNKFQYEPFHKYIISINEKGNFDIALYDPLTDIGLHIRELDYVHTLQNIYKANHEINLSFKKIKITIKN